MNLIFVKTGVESPDARILLDELNETLIGILGHNGAAHVCLDDFSCEKAFFLVGYEGGTPVCCAGVRKMNDSTGEIKRVYARKNSKGIGSALMAEVEKKAKEAGYGRLVLECREGNSHAIEFYKREGYSVCEKYPPYGSEADAVCLEKHLTPASRQELLISGIPSILWGKPSDRVFIHVHGKMSRKEYAESFAAIADKKSYQTLSFDLPEHGDRAGLAVRCDIWNGIRDLNAIADYAFEHWKHVSLYACSLGAYFSLSAYPERKLEKCLFQSPVVDMKWLVEHIMLWSGVTPEQLQQEKEISTPIDTLRWDYYQYILAHPAGAWPFPTSILYAGKDNLQPEASIRAFAQKHNAELTIAENSQHPFMEPEDGPIVEKWLRAEID